jgi:YHS domain-containing protein
MSVVQISRLTSAFALAFVVAAFTGTTNAQAPTAQPAGQQHEGHTTAAGGHDMSEMAREGSGTAWLPDESPMYAIHAMKGSWSLMFHENAFLQYLHEPAPRGDDQGGSINWVMGMAQRNIGAGRLGLRGMLSLEPWSIRGCGYPDLLATGEECNGEKIHDRQHPHDLFIELAAVYSAPIAGDLRWQVYAAPVGEPALGPVAYPHRVSAMPNPLAPIAHHWLDATHITFGLVTGAVYGKRWKAETSVFNGREPDEERTDLDFGALDSVSGRVWFMPMPRLALQVSAGHLKEAEVAESGTPIDVNRVTASATYHRMFGDNSIWATTVAWGRNAEPDHASNALLVEANMTVNQRDTVYGRFEVVGKTPHDLDVPESLGEGFTLTKLQGGYTRYLPAWNGFQPGVGGSISLAVVPEALQSAYGRRANTGVAVYLTLRPAAMMHGTTSGASTPVDHSQHTTAGQPADHSQHATPPAQPAGPPGARETAPQSPRPTSEPRLPVAEAERVIDPACAATIDLVNAPKATYQGKVYYFCSAGDRDAFVKDPAAFLKKRAK